MFLCHQVRNAGFQRYNYDRTLFLAEFLVLVHVHEKSSLRHVVYIHVQFVVNQIISHMHTAKTHMLYGMHHRILVFK